MTQIIFTFTADDGFAAVDLDSGVASYAYHPCPARGATMRYEITTTRHDTGAESFLLKIMAYKVGYAWQVTDLADRPLADSLSDGEFGMFADKADAFRDGCAWIDAQPVPSRASVQE